MALTGKGHKLHGISRKEIAIEATESAGRCLAVALEKGSVLFHGHAKLVRALGGKEAAVNSADPEALWTLQRIGSFCSLLRKVVSLYMGERRENLQCYLDWACLRRYANTMKPKERKEFMLSFCAATGTDYKRPGKKRPGKHQW